MQVMKLDTWLRNYLRKFEGETWFLLTAYSKMQEMDVLDKKEVEYKDLKNSQPIHIVKMRKYVWEGT